MLPSTIVKGFHFSAKMEAFSLIKFDLRSELKGTPLDLVYGAVQTFKAMTKLFCHVVERWTCTKLIGFVGVVVGWSEEIVWVISAHGLSPFVVPFGAGATTTLSFVSALSPSHESGVNG